MKDVSQYRVIIFDLDGTLVESFKTTPLPGRVECIATLQEQGVRIAICTNQEPIIWRWATGQEKYPDAEKIAGNLVGIHEALGLSQIPWFVSIGDTRTIEIMGDVSYNAALLAIENRLLSTLNPKLFRVSGRSDWRKPDAGMLVEAAWRFDVPVADCLFVGARNEDRQAAEKCSMPFMHANDFFEDEDLGELAIIHFREKG